MNHLQTPSVLRLARLINHCTCGLNLGSAQRPGSISSANLRHGYQASATRSSCGLSRPLNCRSSIRGTQRRGLILSVTGAVPVPEIVAGVASSSFRRARQTRISGGSVFCGCFQTQRDCAPRRICCHKAGKHAAALNGGGTLLDRQRSTTCLDASTGLGEVAPVGLLTKQLLPARSLFLKTQTGGTGISSNYLRSWRALFAGNFLREISFLSATIHTTGPLLRPPPNGVHCLAVTPTALVQFSGARSSAVLQQTLVQLKLEVAILGLQTAVRSEWFHTGTNPTKMAKSKFEYVRQFETDDPCLQNCWIVVRIDGKAFHKFTDSHHYMKPNDDRGLSLMTRAAQTVMSEFNEIVLAYGQSDEYSFVFHKNCKLYNRRASKIMTNVVSLFSSSFTLYWSRFFNSQELQYPPSFDGRVVLYPSDDNLRDYLSWRQADCHINNLYNTCFWKLVQEKGLTPNKAAERLKGTLSSDKNEMLFSDFGINYNTLPELYRKGSVLIRPRSAESESPNPERSINNYTRGHEGRASKKPGSVTLHTDIIGKKFWEDNPHVLNPKI